MPRGTRASRLAGDANGRRGHDGITAAAAVVGFGVA